MDQAFTVDVVPHIPMLRRYALKLARNPPDADDLVQDCLLRALARGHQFEPGTNLAAWLATILRNLFLTRYQRAMRIVEVELEPEIAEVSMEASQFHSVELQDTEAAIRDLAPEQRQVIHKCGVEGVSYEDAASEMGVSVGTIRSRLSRARSQLREQVAGRIRPSYLNSRPTYLDSGTENHQAVETKNLDPDLPGLDTEERDLETLEVHVGEPERIMANDTANDSDDVGCMIGGSMIAPAAFAVPPSFRLSFCGNFHTAPGLQWYEHGATQTHGFHLSVERANSRGGGPPERIQPPVAEAPQTLSGIS